MEKVYNRNRPIVSMKDIRKSFSGVHALSGMTFDLYEGEIHCLVGENGAGKSTLMKILSGAYVPDSGIIEIDGIEHDTLTPSLSQSLGINIIYQENLLVPTMTVAENIFIGNEKTLRAGFMDFNTMYEIAQREIDYLGIDINPRETIENLSVADQQFVKILKALVVNPRVLIMDEPTSMFNVEDANRVLDLVKKIAEKGISVVYISHFLKEIVQIADRITVIRDGLSVNCYSNENKDMDLEVITRDMVGRPVDMFYVKEECPIGEVIFEVKDLKINKDSPKISFNLRRGEILGIAGMIGSGRTEIIQAISGATKKYSGTIKYKGRDLDIKSPADSIEAGIGHITEDRQGLGLALGLSVLENLTIVGLRNKIQGFFVNTKNHPSLVNYIIDELNIRTASIHQEVRFLSGGNQQKVVLGKWLFADSNILIFDEPTRGIDVNSKAEFYKMMSTLTKEGKSIIMISSDMPELISMSDRVLVVRKEAIVDEISKDKLTEQAIIKSALEVTEND